MRIDYRPARGASSSSSGNTGQVQVDFGVLVGAVNYNVKVTVTGQTWVTASSKISCFASGVATTDHVPEDYSLDQIAAYATNLQVGVGFDIIAYAIGGARGKYLINYIGI